MTTEFELSCRDARIEELSNALRAERARSEKLLEALEIEQVYGHKLAQQLLTLTRSRLWRGLEWVRRITGRERFAPDLERPSPALPSASMVRVFSDIYATNAWGSASSHSGKGSDLEQTAVIREVIPALLGELGVRSMLDIPCGDFHWMRMLNLNVAYIGGDVVGELIAANNARYGDERRRFEVIDVANDALPRVDLVFCRDLLVHFSFRDALRAIANLKRSGSTYFLTTTFTERTIQDDIRTGQWRPVNLQLPPFDFCPPLRIINENCTEGLLDASTKYAGSARRRARSGPQGHARGAWSDKSLGLWRFADL